MDIYDVLERDHEELKALLEELVSLRDDDDYRYVLIEEINHILIPHSRAEESVFYNTLRAVKADRSLVFHGFQEHLEAETLLRTLQVMDRMNLSWKATAKKLQEALLHHIQEEEGDIFDEAKQAFTTEEAQAMGDAFEQLKPQIEKEGPLKNAMDLVINMMPPKLADKVRHLGD